MTESYVVTFSISMRVTGYCVKCLVIYDAVQFGKHVPLPAKSSYAVSHANTTSMLPGDTASEKDRSGLHIKYSFSLFLLRKTN